MNRAVVLRRRDVLLPELICQLVTFCLLYSTPTLAHDHGRYVSGAIATAETLDPKHDKDHDEEREGERGARGHCRGG